MKKILYIFRNEMTRRVPRDRGFFFIFFPPPIYRRNLGHVSFRSFRHLSRRRVKYGGPILSRIHRCPAISFHPTIKGTPYTRISEYSVRRGEFNDDSIINVCLINPTIFPRVSSSYLRSHYFIYQNKFVEIFSKEKEKKKRETIRNGKTSRPRDLEV